MPELRDKRNIPSFVPAGPEVNIHGIGFKDKIREKSRQKRLAAELASGGKNAKQIKAEQRAAERIAKSKERRAGEIAKGQKKSAGGGDSSGDDRYAESGNKVTPLILFNSGMMFVSTCLLCPYSTLKVERTILRSLPSNKSYVSPPVMPESNDLLHDSPLRLSHSSYVTHRSGLLHSPHRGCC